MLSVRCTLGSNVSHAPFTYLGALSPLLASAALEACQEVSCEKHLSKGPSDLSRTSLIFLVSIDCLQTFTFAPLLW